MKVLNTFPFDTHTPATHSKAPKCLCSSTGHGYFEFRSKSQFHDKTEYDEKVAKLVDYFMKLFDGYTSKDPAYLLNFGLY